MKSWGGVDLDEIIYLDKRNSIFVFKLIIDMSHTKHNCCRIWPSGLPVWAFFSCLLRLARSTHLPFFRISILPLPHFSLPWSITFLPWISLIHGSYPTYRSVNILQSLGLVLNLNLIHFSSIPVFPILSWEIYGIWKTTIRNLLLWKFIIVKNFTLILLKHNLLYILFNIYTKCHYC